MLVASYWGGGVAPPPPKHSYWFVYIYGRTGQDSTEMRFKIGTSNVKEEVCF